MITQVELKQKQVERPRAISFWEKIINGYANYCKAQEKEKVYWYLKAIMVIPCILMRDILQAQVL